MIDFEKVKRELMSESTDWVDEAPSRPYGAKLRCLYTPKPEGDSFQLYPSGLRGVERFPIFPTRNALQTYLQKKMRGLISQVDEISNLWYKNHAQESVTDYGFIVLTSGPEHFKIVLRVSTTNQNCPFFLQPEMENI